MFLKKKHLIQTVVYSFIQPQNTYLFFKFKNSSGLHLSGSPNYADLGVRLSANTCFPTPGNCTQGLTVSIWYKILGSTTTDNIYGNNHHD